MTDDELLKQPIIILGAPHWGTTLLSKILGQHRDVAHLIEPRMTRRFGNDRKSDMLQPEDATPRVITHIRKRFADLVTEQAKTRLVKKTPSNSLRSAFVQSVFPDAKFVHISRNGYDACLSTEDCWNKHSSGISNVAEGRLMQCLKEFGPWRLPYYLPEFARRIAPGPFKKLISPNQWGPLLPSMSAMLRDLGPVAVSCLQCRAYVGVSCHFGRDLPKDQYFEFKLEDVNSSLIDDVLNFCELSEDLDIQNYIEETFDVKRAGARTRKAKPEQILAAKPWIESTILWLGHTSSDCNANHESLAHHSNP